MMDHGSNRTGVGGDRFLGNGNGNGSTSMDRETTKSPTMAHHGSSSGSNLGGVVNNTSKSAERYKGLGNKQMANQQYKEAYDSYSHAIDLITSSEIETSSSLEVESQLYVYYSNRAAACLSLKRYNDAIEDANKSIQLKPTFGKAHARLGQALYFSRQYQDSVNSYRTSLKLDETQGLGISEVTVSYLDKAERKLQKKKKNQQQQQSKQINDAAIDTSLTSTSTSPTRDQQSPLSLSSPQQMATTVDSVPQQQQQQNIHDQQEQQQQQQEQAQSPLHHTSQQQSPPVNSEQLNYFHRKAETHYGRGEYMLALKDYNAAFQLMEDEELHNIIQEQKYQMLVHRGMCYCKVAELSSNSNSNLDEDGMIDVDKYYIAATHDARDAIQHNPTYFAGYRVLGRALFYQQNLQEALWAFTEALTLMSAHSSNQQDDGGTSRQRYNKSNSTTNTRFRVDHVTPKEYAEDEQLWAKCKQALRKEQERNEHNIIQPTTINQGYNDRNQFQEQQQEEHQQSDTAGMESSMTGETNSSSSNNNAPPPLSTIPIVGRTKSNIPKLKPPRFVPREQAISTTPNVTRMPKHWPKQYHTQMDGDDDNFWVGNERNLIIHNGGGMGMKLHRGTDGFVRVLSTTPAGGGSSEATKLAPREGYVDVGDVVREVAGVDLRRPITNPMWADTVHLIKMTPRPITFVVAPEISKPPLSVQEELRKSLSQSDLERFIKRPPPSQSHSHNSPS